MTTKLWSKGDTQNNDKAHRVEKFTVGNDAIFDLLLAEHDIAGTKAHAAMLAKINLLTEEENRLIQKALDEIIAEVKSGDFVIEEGIEDVHSQIETLLTRRLGEPGKKIHSGRSRNDQVLLAIKLYLRSEVKAVAKECKQLFDRLIHLSEKHKDNLLPGYTHFQVAMPSSFGLWFSAYAESLSDDLELLLATYRIINKNPLGSAAGYGSSFPLDRSYVTGQLGMQDLNYSSVYAQMTRGKSEKVMAMALSSIAATLSKFAYDVCLYMNTDFGFIGFPADLTTGSSIMPHKKNPDVFELIRAKCNRIQSVPNELTLLTNNLPSGYHRDFQLTKECLFPAINSLKECLQMADFMFGYINVKKDLLKQEKYKYLFSVEEVNKKVLRGIPFREAYVEVGKSIENGGFEPDITLNHTHEGSIGRLCLDKIVENFTHLYRQIE
jgi:argininosuccinate lyase